MGELTDGECGRLEKPDDPVLINVTSRRRSARALE